MKRLLFKSAALVSVLLLFACKPEEEEPKVIINPPTDTPTQPSQPSEPATPPSTLGQVKITLRDKDVHSISISGSGGTYRLSAIGADPYVYSDPLASTVDPDYKMLEFEYTCDAQVNDLQVFYCIGGTASEANSKKYGSLSATSTYKKFTADISVFRARGWGKAGDLLRFDPGDNGGLTFTIRNIVVREMTADEKAESQAVEDREKAKQDMAKRLGEYLSKDYPSEVTNVSVSADKVTIKGTLGGDGSYVLAEICPWQDVTEMDTFPYTTEISGSAFEITVDRIAKSREGIDYDKVFSKWAVVKVDGTSQTLDSHARYADDVAPVQSPEKAVLKNKKGLGAGNIDLYYQDCKDMDCGSVTMNIVLNGLIDRMGTDYTYGGVSYALGSWKGEIDRMVSKCKDAGVVVAAIILTQTESSYKDPENEGGFYTMPNMTTPEGFNMYAAALTYMASRYCQDTPGRIHHWIMHNEVDMGTDWTNMGDQPMLRFLDRYIKSMRICYNIVRQYDQNAYILGSYTHNWNQADGNYKPKEMLSRTVDYSNAEGDFQWGLAYHPYPQDLTKPEFWKNDTQSTWDLDTKYITFKNLEVIDKWIKLPENLYKGETKRLLFLSEQGTNSPSYSTGDLNLQAAGGAWAWKKVAGLDGIDAIQWHNWADNKAEFGLRIGLRSFDEGSWAGLTPKPVWYVWKAAGSEDESTIFDQYLPVLGVKSWSEIMHETK